MKRNHIVKFLIKKNEELYHYGASFLIALFILEVIKLIIIYHFQGYQDLDVFKNILTTFLSDGFYFLRVSIFVFLSYITKNRFVRILLNLLSFIGILLFCADLFYIFLLGTRITIQEIYQSINLGFFLWRSAIIGFILLCLLLQICAFHKKQIRKVIISILIGFLITYFIIGIYLITKVGTIPNCISDNIIVRSLLFTKNKGSDDITFIAHRGVTQGGIPENSLESFYKAKELGADGIEFDVVQTNDGEYIVLHDEELSTSKECSDKKVSDFTYEYIYNNCKLINGEKYLRLEDVLRKIDGLFEYYFLEIKVFNEDLGEEITRNIIDIVKSLNMQNKVIFISYSDSAKRILEATDGIIYGRDTFNNRDLSKIGENKSSYFLLPYINLSADIISRSITIGKKVVTYTVNDIKNFERVKNLGVNVIMTDKLMELKNHINK